MEFRSLKLSWVSSLQSSQPRLQDQSPQSPTRITLCLCSKPLGHSRKSKLSLESDFWGWSVHLLASHAKEPGPRRLSFEPGLVRLLLC